jgi:hypothetical protein
MCWKVKIPKVSTTGKDLVPETNATAPDSPMMGGADEVYKKTGKESLKIALGDTSDTDPVYF